MNAKPSNCIPVPSRLLSKQWQVTNIALKNKNTIYFNATGRKEGKREEEEVEGEKKANDFNAT